MKKMHMRVILLVLVVVLLTIVSSRISPKLPENNTPSVSVPDDFVENSPAPGGNTIIETPDITPPQESQEPLPAVSIHEWNLKVVNNINVLSSAFAPDVSEVADGQYFDTRAVDALNALLEAAKSQGFTTYLSTAYRPYSTQAYIFFGKASQIAYSGEIKYADAEMMAREIVAYPGTSEHQLGLAVDIVDSSSTVLDADMVEDMPLLVWLAEHCHEYGFILRYPKDKEDITGWYEPWHFRYVGVDAATYIMEKGICLEEFVQLYY